VSGSAVGRDVAKHGLWGGGLKPPRHGLGGLKPLTKQKYSPPNRNEAHLPFWARASKLREVFYII